jgi:hypothetical protein
MIKKNIVFVFILIAGISGAQTVTEKVIHLQSPSFGQYTLHILPFGYDSTISDEQIAACIDTMPGHLFAAKMYNLLYKDDTTKLAVKANEGIYFFHKRYTIEVYWKTGNKKEIAYLGRHHHKYKQFNYYENDVPASVGHYKNGHKVKKWKYFNTDCRKTKVEKYAKDGSVKKSKAFDKPKKTLRSLFNPKHTKGAHYIIT